MRLGALLVGGDKAVATPPKMPYSVLQTPKKRQSKETAGAENGHEFK